MRHKKKNKFLRFIIFLAIIISFLLLSAYATQLVAQINLLLKGDLTIFIEPNQKNILTKRGKAEELPFEIKIENRNFCKGSCNYEFRDLSNENTIDFGKFEGVKGTIIEKNYIVTPPKKGTGQLAYEFYVECTNGQSFLCQSPGKKRIKSSFITISYERSIEETSLIKKVQTNFLSYLNKTIQIDKEIKSIGYELNILKNYLNTFDLAEKFSLTYGSFSKIKGKIGSLKELWAEEEYSALEKNVTEDLEKSIKIELEVQNLKQDIEKEKESFGKYRQNIIELENNFSLTEQTMKSEFLLSKNYSETKEKVEQDYLSLIETFNNVTYKSFLSLDANILLFSKNTEDSYDSVKTELEEELKKELEEKGNLSYSISSLRMNELINEIKSNCNLNSLNLTDENLTSENSTNKTNSINNSINKTKTTKEICINLNELNKLENKTFEISINKSLINIPENISEEFKSDITLKIKEQKPICCIFGECKVCCEGDECLNNPQLYPVLLVHGHAFSKQTNVETSLLGFSGIKQKLTDDGFINGGTILPVDSFLESDKNILGRFAKPLFFDTTYYVDAKDNQGKFIYVPSKSESIEVYAQRLNKTIELIKYKTGASKINIIAHSMGGLVSRKYLIDYGEESVSKLIMIGTPNKGIVGKIDSFCFFTGEERECDEMSSESSFINKLNNPVNNPKKVKVFTIIGRGCNMNSKDGDGVVLSENAALDFSLNFNVIGNCEGGLLHQKLLDMQIHPEVYDIIRNILK